MSSFIIFWLFFCFLWSCCLNLIHSVQLQWDGSCTITDTAEVIHISVDIFQLTFWWTILIVHFHLSYLFLQYHPFYYFVPTTALLFFISNTFFLLRTFLPSLSPCHPSPMCPYFLVVCVCPVCLFFSSQSQVWHSEKNQEQGFRGTEC